MAGLIVRKPDGTALFDTQYITHGLVKSAYLTPDERWYRYYLRADSADPDDGRNYNPGSGVSGEQMFSITVNNAINPICFIVGKGQLAGTYRSGNTIKFFYNGGDQNTKAYVFDLMSDNVPGNKPWLKTRRADGSISFNSLQPPLNVLYSIQTPAPANADAYRRWQNPIAGGSWQAIQSWDNGKSPIWHYVADIALPAGIEYAAFLNYARLCRAWWTQPSLQIVGMSEGAYGRVGGISFMFGTAAATTELRANTNQSITPTIEQLATDKYPTALVIRTDNLPFPFN